MVVPETMLVFNDALGPGFRPKPESFMTASVLLETVDGGTCYTARLPQVRSRAQA